MKELVSFLGFAWYILGLVLLWQASYIGWFIFGIFIPIIPWVYAIVHFLT